MDVVGLLLFVVHLVALVAAGGSSVAMPIVGRKLATATPEVRGQLTEIADALRRISRWALVVLLLSGVLTLWLRWNWQAPNAWFWVKMAGVLAIIVLVGMADMATRKARQGDAAAAGRARMLGQVTGVALLVVILAAVFAFN
jgi:protoporphyrinogen IX oxidase